MKSKKVIFLFVIVLIFNLGLFAQEDIQNKEELSRIYDEALRNYKKFDYPRAIVLFREFIKNSQDRSMKAKAYLKLGDIYKFRFEYPEARYYYQKVIENFPDSSVNIKAQFLIARTFDEEYKFIRALDYYNNILMSDYISKNIKEISKDEVDNILKKELELEDYEEVVKRLPKSPHLIYAYIQLSKSYLKNGKYEKAIDLLEDVIDIDKDGSVKALYQVAKLRGKFPGAKIGIMLPFSGKYNQISNRLYHSILLLQKYRNLNLDKKITLIKADTSGDVNRAGVLYEKLVKNGAQIVIGPIQGECADSLKPYVKKHKVPVIFLLTGDSDIVDKSKYFYRNAIRKVDEARALAQYGVEKLKLTHFGALVPSDENSLDIADSFKKYVENYHANLDIIETYKRGDKTYTEQLEKIQKSFVDGFFLKGTNYEDLHQIIPTIPYVGLKVNVLADSNLLNDKILRVLKDQINGFIVASYFNKNNFGILENQIYDKFKEKYNYELNQYTVLAIDAFNVAFEAIRRSSGIKGENLLYALNSINQEDGFCGEISVLNSGDIKKEIFLYEIKNGVPKRIKFSVEQENIVEIK